LVTATATALAFVAVTWHWTVSPSSAATRVYSLLSAPAITAPLRNQLYASVGPSSHRPGSQVSVSPAAGPDEAGAVFFTVIVYVLKPLSRAKVVPLPV
jgi:hypothetical protein